MIRLVPSTIPLTRGEIAQYEMRAEERRSRLLQIVQRHARDVNFKVANPPASLHLRQGPQRPLIYGESPTPSSASSDSGQLFLEPTIDSRRATARDRGTQELSNDTTRSHTSALASNFRRDSVMSYTQYSDHQEAKYPPRQHGQRHFEASERDDDHFSASRMLQGLRLDDDRRPPTSFNMHRRCHTRSLSDPSEIISPRAATGLRRSRMSNRKRSSSTVSDDSFQSRGSGHEATILPGQGQSHGSDFSDHVRHQSLPENAGLTSTGNQSHKPTTLTTTQVLTTDQEDSALRRALRNQYSPLDTLATDLADLKDVIETAPSKSPATPRGVVAIRFPDFRDDDDDGDNGDEVRPTLRGGTIDDARRPAVLPHATIDTSSPLPSLTPAASIRTPATGRRGGPLSVYTEVSAWAPGRSMPAEFSLPQGRRGGSIELARTQRSLIHRRPLPNAEQENEEQMASFQEERRAYIARQIAPSQGRLQNTPSPEGRLERMLR